MCWCVGSAAVDASRKATSTVPIIMFGNFDPVALGLVANLARPEANVTGILIAADGTLAGKRIEMLRELVPKSVRVGMLATADRGFRAQIDETRVAARVLGITLDVVEVQGRDYAAAFARLATQKPDALVVGASTFSWPTENRSSPWLPNTVGQPSMSGLNRYVTVVCWLMAPAWTSCMPGSEPTRYCCRRAGNQPNYRSSSPRPTGWY